MKQHNSISEAITNNNSQSNVDLETSHHSADELNQIRQLLEKYSASIETFQQVNIKQVIFNYCLSTEESFELETFLVVLHLYDVHIKDNFSFGLILWTLNNDGTTTYSYFHSAQ